MTRIDIVFVTLCISAMILGVYFGKFLGRQAKKSKSTFVSSFSNQIGEGTSTFMFLFLPNLIMVLGKPFVTIRVESVNLWFGFFWSLLAGILFAALSSTNEEK